MDTLFFPLVGGILIGLASVIILAILGKVAGVSGIIFSLLQKPAQAEKWKLFFLLGLVIGAVISYGFKPSLFSYSINGSIIKVIIAGLLVGFGTRLGGGCTSGHGICGVSRFSKRSFVATMIFIIMGMVTVSLENL